MDKKLIFIDEADKVLNEYFISAENNKDDISWETEVVTDIKNKIEKLEMFHGGVKSECRYLWIW